MRFYLTSIQFNKEAQAENRTAPKAFDKLEDAVTEFFSQVAKDRKNATLGWSVNYITNEFGGIYPDYVHRWDAKVEETKKETEKAETEKAETTDELVMN